MDSLDRPTAPAVRTEGADRGDLVCESMIKHALSMNETKQNELKELMGVQKPARDKFDEYCHMLEHQYNPKTETKQFNANKKLVQSIRGMYIDYEDVEKSNVELGSGAFGVAYKGIFLQPTHF